MTTPSITNTYQTFKVNVPEKDSKKVQPAAISNKYQEFETTLATTLKKTPENKLLGSAGEAAENLNNGALPKDFDFATPQIDVAVEKQMARIDNSSSDIDTQQKINAKRKKKLLDDLVAEQALKDTIGRLEEMLPNVSGTKSAPPGKDAKSDTLLDTMDEFLNSSKKDDLEGEDVEEYRIIADKTSALLREMEQKAKQKAADKAQIDDLWGDLDFGNDQEDLFGTMDDLLFK